MISGIEAQAEAMRERFRGAGIRIGQSSVVHAQELCPWIGGVMIPAPLCHTGFAVDPHRLHPAYQPPTCRLCIRRPLTRPQQAAGQLTII